jgi:hypothetical protein
MTAHQVPNPEKPWTAGTSEEMVTVFDVRFTGLRRRVGVSSTAARTLPLLPPEPQPLSDASRAALEGRQ